MQNRPLKLSPRAQYMRKIILTYKVDAATALFIVGHIATAKQAGNTAICDTLRANGYPRMADIVIAEYNRQ